MAVRLGLAPLTALAPSGPGPTPSTTTPRRLVLTTTPPQERLGSDGEIHPDYRALVDAAAPTAADLHDQRLLLVTGLAPDARGRTSEIWRPVATTTGPQWQQEADI